MSLRAFESMQAGISGFVPGLFRAFRCGFERDRAAGRPRCPEDDQRRVVFPRPS
jgi:hypothetical protein